jgi:hypothetical protein
MARRYRAGETIDMISAATGLHRTTVHHRLKRAGVEFRPPIKATGHGRLDLPDAAIVERYRAGETTTAIGRPLGVSAQVVRERLIEAGVERRRLGTHRRPAARAKERPGAPNRRGAKRRAIEELLNSPESKGMTQR